MRTALTIAGSDSSGGAGIQADIKTMMANGVFAMSAITALTAQNTMGVTAIMDATPEFLEEELDEVFRDIFPDAVKIGMVSQSSLIRSIAKKLHQYQPQHIVVDPVMVATSGAKLISDDAVATLKEELLPIAEVITPNIPETEVLSGMKVQSEQDMEAAGCAIARRYGCAVLCKGGHNLNDANDLLIYPAGSHTASGKNNTSGTAGGHAASGEAISSAASGENRIGNISVSSLKKTEDGLFMRWFYGKRIDNPNTHGTGCTLSSAIASNLAKGYDLETSIARAKDYISGALGAMLNLGHGHGPMNHAFDQHGRFMEYHEKQG